MKKKILVIIISIIVIAVFVLGLIYFVNKKDKKGKLNSLYEKIKSGQDYICTIEENESNKIILAKKGDNFLTETYSKEANSSLDVEHTSTLIKDDRMYYILHNREEYYTYARGNNENNILLQELEEILSDDFKSGKENVNGKKYNYEEFKGIFIFSNEIDEEENLNTKFFFKGNDLMYIKTVTEDKQKIRKVEIKYDVDDSIFEIPSNYAEV